MSVISNEKCRDVIDKNAEVEDAKRNSRYKYSRLHQPRSKISLTHSQPMCDS